MCHAERLLHTKQARGMTITGSIFFYNYVRKGLKQRFTSQDNACLERADCSENAMAKKCHAERLLHLNQATRVVHFTPNLAPDSRAGGGAPEMGSRLSTLATFGFGVRTSLEATTG